VLQSNQLKEPPEHVVFTTSKTILKVDDSNRLEFVIRENTRLSISRLPRTHYIFFADSNLQIEKNKFGYAVLRDMYLEAMRLYPKASTFTYCNHDLIFNQSFVNTLDGVVESSKLGLISSRFLLVGRRTNVNWTREMFLGDENYHFSFNQVLKQGELFDSDAIDYFTCSPTIWDWNVIPKIVIGRIGYDNWMVNEAMQQWPNVTAIETTWTMPMIHQTTPYGGNYQGHKGTSMENVKYNMKLVNYQWERGAISFCRLVSIWDVYGKVTLVYKIPWRTLAPSLPPSSA
jgi:hypothetical protein